jgi:hypothetical protein
MVWQPSIFLASIFLEDRCLINYQSRSRAYKLQHKFGGEALAEALGHMEASDNEG